MIWSWWLGDPADGHPAIPACEKPYTNNSQNLIYGNHPKWPSVLNTVYIMQYHEYTYRERHNAFPASNFTQLIQKSFGLEQFRFFPDLWIHMHTIQVWNNLQTTQLFIYNQQ